MLKFYAYRSCDGCRKAKKWLEENGIPLEEIAIRDISPSTIELAEMLEARGALKAMFSTSGGDYRSMGLSTKVAKMTPAEAFELMSKNGNLIKRPFLIGENEDKKITLQGFRLQEWQAALVNVA